MRAELTHGAAPFAETGLVGALTAQRWLCLHWGNFSAGADGSARAQACGIHKHIREEVSWRKRGFWRLAPFAVVVALLLAVACGGGDDEETSATTGNDDVGDADTGCGADVNGDDDHDDGVHRDDRAAVHDDGDDGGEGGAGR